MLNRPYQCGHDVIEPNRISDNTIEYYCKACGEVIGTSIDTSKNPEGYVTGKARELTEEEKERLA